MATMHKVCVIKLIGKVHSRGEYGEDIVEEYETPVFAERHAISRYEWTNAGLQGYHPQCVVTIFDFEYNGEDVVELDGKRYFVYRTYERDDDKLELYLERRQGDEVEK